MEAQIWDDPIGRSAFWPAGRGWAGEWADSGLTCSCWRRNETKSAGGGPLEAREMLQYSCTVRYWAPLLVRPVRCAGNRFDSKSIDKASWRRRGLLAGDGVLHAS